MDIVSQRLKILQLFDRQIKSFSLGHLLSRRTKQRPLHTRVNYHVIGENLYFINHTVNLLGRLQHLSVLLF